MGRTNTGQFTPAATPTTPPSSDIRRQERFRDPYFEHLNTPYPEEKLLDAMRRARASTGLRPTTSGSKRKRSGTIEARLWRKDFNDESNIRSLLSSVGDFLVGDAPLQTPTTPYEPRYKAFLQPLLSVTCPTDGRCIHPRHAKCMHFSEPTGARFPDNFTVSSRYLKLTLAYDARDDHVIASDPGASYGAIKEGAHRLVLWAIFGPPNVINGRDAVVMHSCGQPTCLNPHHMVWGTASENLEDARALRHDPSLTEAQIATDRIIERMHNL